MFDSCVCLQKSMISVITDSVIVKIQRWTYNLYVLSFFITTSCFVASSSRRPSLNSVSSTLRRPERCLKVVKLMSGRSVCSSSRRMFYSQLKIIIDTVNSLVHSYVSFTVHNIFLLTFFEKVFFLQLFAKFVLE